MIADTKSAPVEQFCPYLSDDDLGSVSVNVTFTSEDFTHRPTDEPVSGIAERAVWDATTQALFAWTGTAGITVTVFAFDQDKFPPKDIAVAVARRVTTS
jgi:hypothetical protein